MRISFFGASKIVTGSCYLIETGDLKFLVDCGMFQGPKEIREFNYHNFLFNPADIDYVLLTHAHIDHSGLLPKLYNKGFKGKIISTSGTIELCEILLPDSAYIQETEVKRINKKNLRSGRPLINPIYTVEDAYSVLKFFEKIEYNQELQLSDDLKIIFRNSGHILGSGFIEIYYNDTKKNKKLKIIFSGDLGHDNLAIIKKPERPLTADFLILESTYGNRIHQFTDFTKRKDELKKIILETISRKGKLIIPAFAVERTQDLLFTLNKLFSNNEVPEIPVYIDSPLSVEATKVFCRHPQYYNEETFEYVTDDSSPFDLPNFNFTKSVEESENLNDIAGPCIIISSSGMCEAGRIKHHLKHNLWRDNSTVLFVGYQADGTLGRRLIDGEKIVRIHGEPVSVKAKIINMEGFSAHADKTALISWLTNFVKFPSHIFLVHGEPTEIEGLKQAIISNFSQDNIIVPELGDIYELLTGNKIIQKDNLYKSRHITEEPPYFEKYTRIKKLLKELITLRKNENAVDVLVKEFNDIETTIEMLLKR